jgi:formylglycine-generating enzyme required for sulfatase activity
MGASKEDFVAGDAENEKQHHVMLSPFLIAKYEVTQQEWNDLMGSLPPLLAAVGRSTGPRFPIEMISREDAQQFCEKYGFSLPSEAQWEYACRGGSTGAFSGTGLLDEMAWYSENSGDKSHPVGTKRPNHFGLHDMHGNLEEWCRDTFAPFYGLPEAGGPDPVCTSGGLGTHVKRGGSYAQNAYNCRSAARSNEGPGSQGHGTGVRPAFLLR